jgi:hypothetical protein
VNTPATDWLFHYPFEGRTQHDTSAKSQKCHAATRL